MSFTPYLETPFPVGSLTQRLSFCVFHFLSGSFFYDSVHWLAHHSQRSRFRVLRMLAKAHAIHHQYFDRNLRYNERFRSQNLIWHQTLELLCQMIGSTMSWTFCLLAFRGLALDMAPDLILVLFLQVARTAVVVWNSGHDSNHIPYPRLPKDPFTFFVGPQYHALHHIDPLNYFGSMTRLLDWWMGTAVSLRGRRVTMTGSSGALGQALAEQLRLEGVRSISAPKFGIDWAYDDYSYFESALQNTDVLILTHGSKNGKHDFEANCESAVKIIEIFRESCSRRKLGLLPEVWYVGSEAELHGAWTSDMQTYTGSKRAFVRHARAFYDEETFNYRHIVPAAFASSMGPGLVSARWAARVALWWIRRGARYVPVTYTGLAFVNFLRFKLGRRLANQQGHKPQRSTSLEGPEPGGKPALSLRSL